MSETNAHYTSMKIEPWEALEAWLTEDEFRGYMMGNIIKYMARAGKKGPRVQDLSKAQAYLDELLHYERKKP